MVPGLLPLDPISSEGEWRWWLLAWSIEVEAFPEDFVGVPIVIDFQEGQSDVKAAGVVVRLDVEHYRLVLRGGGEVVHSLVLVASRLLANIDVHVQ